VRVPPVEPTLFPVPSLEKQAAVDVSEAEGGLDGVVQGLADVWIGGTLINFDLLQKWREGFVAVAYGGDDRKRTFEKFRVRLGPKDVAKLTVLKRRVVVPVIQRNPAFGVGGTQLYVVQTYRQKEQGDTIFLEHVSETGTVRLVIPPQVAAVIARQREQLTAKTRSKAAKAVAQERKERGELPAFLNRKRNTAKE